MPTRLNRGAGATARVAFAFGAVCVALLPLPVHSQAAADGERVYASSCVACHQPTGTGVPGAFPPLAKHVPTLLSQPEGREYLIKTVLFGLEGKVRIDGADFQGVMPPWNALGDSDLAAVLNHVSDAWGNAALRPKDFMPFVAGEIKAARQSPLTPSALLAGRPGGVGAASSVTAAQGKLVSFTAEQAARGKAIYTRRCVDCHGSTLDNGEFGGAPLNGAYFKGHWGAGPVAALVAYTKVRMPPDGPGSLSDQSYVDVVSYLLSMNGYASGDAELPADPDAQQAMTLRFGQ
jgi:mono/diheme cytochrome c family protein